MLASLLFLRNIIVIILLLSFSGCATTSEQSSFESESEETHTTSTLAVTAKLRFPDVPVPVGFKLIEDKSFVFQTENTRVALLKYLGRARQEDLVDFYKEQMLFYNWNLLNMVEYERSILNFERAEQSCIITIEPKGRAKIITISVAPKARGNIGTKQQSK